MHRNLVDNEIRKWQDYSVKSHWRLFGYLVIWYYWENVHFGISWFCHVFFFSLSLWIFEKLIAFGRSFNFSFFLSVTKRQKLWFLRLLVKLKRNKENKLCTLCIVRWTHEMTMMMLKSTVWCQLMRIVSGSHSLLFILLNLPWNSSFVRRQSQSLWQLMNLCLSFKYYFLLCFKGEIKRNHRHLLLRVNDKK